MAEVRAQSIKTEGDNNVQQVAGGDIVFGHKYIQQDPDFFPPALEYVQPPGFEHLETAQELIAILRGRRVLILAGRGSLEKSTLAHYLAWRLSDKLRRQDGHEADEQVLVREWIRSSVPPKLNAFFHTEKKSTIFVLPRILPYHVDYNPDQLRRIADETNHYVLMTTDTPRSQWTLDAQGSAGHIWQELAARQIYSEDYLSRFLLRELAAVEEPLPEGVLSRPGAECEDPHQPLVEGLSIRDAARQLETPDRIRSLVRWLGEIPSPIPAAQVCQYIEHLRGDKAAIRRWYRQLDDRQQLLALGLALFDGLLDDQLFAALEVMVDHVWRPRNPTLEAFDYKDLEALSGYFKHSSTDSGGIVVGTNSFHQRHALFEVAWELHSGGEPDTPPANREKEHEIRFARPGLSPSGPGSAEPGSRIAHP